MGFIFSIPESLDPSTEMEKGPVFIADTNSDLNAGARDPLMIHAVFVLAAA